MAAFAGMFDLSGKREIDRGRLRLMGEALAVRADGPMRIALEPGLGIVYREGRGEAFAGHGPLRTSRGGLFSSDGRPSPPTGTGEALTAQGRPGAGLPDGGLLAELLDLRGGDGLGELAGAFALAAFGAREDTLLLARSAWGEAPLAFASGKDGLIAFASDHRAIAASGIVHPVLDEGRIAEALFYGYLPTPGTPFANIGELPPGHALHVRRGRPVMPPRAFAPAAAVPDEARKDGARADALAPGFAQALEDAIRRHSSAGCRLVTLSSGPGAQALAGAALPLGDRVRPAIPVRPCGQAGSLAQPLVQALGEPFCDPAALQLSAYLAPLAGEDGAAAMLDDGAEELFGAHARYSRLPPGAAALPAYRHRLHARRAALLPGRTVRRLLAEPLRDSAPEEGFERCAAATGAPSAAAALEADRLRRLPGRTLKLSAALGAAYGVPIARPFLDAALAPFAAALRRAGPAAAMEAMGQADRGAAPQDAVPWSATPCDSLAEAVLTRCHWRDSGLFDVDAAERLAKRRGGAERRQALWSLLIFDLFLEGL